MGKKIITKGKITGIVIGFVLTLTLFFVLVLIQREMLKDTEKTVVVLANRQIKAGTVLTEDNISEYLKEVEISSGLAIKDTYRSKEELVGKYVTRTTAENEIIYAGLMMDDTEILSQYEKPIELSLSISGESSAVAGTIRKGDYVNVYAAAIDGTGGRVYELVLEEVLVNEAYDKNTEKIAMSDTESVALTFTFYMEQKEVPELLKKLETKEVFVTKVK